MHCSARVAAAQGKKTVVTVAKQDNQSTKDEHSILQVMALSSLHSPIDGERMLGVAVSLA